MSTSNVMSDVSSYEGQLKKAHREIIRLKIAENCLDAESAVDHALNAASTLLHLLEWREKDGNPSSSRKARQLCEITQNHGLAVLHDVVTHNKHVKVTKPMTEKSLTPSIYDELTFFCTEDGQPISTEEGVQQTAEDSKIAVYFGNERALDILQIALNEFESQEVNVNEAVRDIPNS